MKKRHSVGNAAVIGLSLLMMTACSHHNPALTQDPDTFAQAVNGYEVSQPHSVGLAANCSEYFMGQANSSIFKSYLKDTCTEYVNQLAPYLQKQPGLTSITVADLQDKVTWQHYWQSRYGHGRGFN